VCRSKHVEQLRNIGIINSTTRSDLVCYFYKICIMMHGSVNIKFTKILDFVFKKFPELLNKRRIKICLTDASVTLSDKVNRFSEMKKSEGTTPLCDQ
jgi:hypothetical protein